MSAIEAAIVVIVICAITATVAWVYAKTQTVNTAIPLKDERQIEADFAAKKASEAARIESMDQEELRAQLNRHRSNND